MNEIDYKYLKAVWDQPVERKWEDLQACYWEVESVKKHMCLEQELNNSKHVEQLIKNDFKSFILNKYIPWKYTDCRWTLRYEEKLKSWKGADKFAEDILDYEERLKHTNNYEERILQEGIELRNELYGIGVAGITGLLSLLIPEVFGTVDKYVAKSMMALGLIEVKNPSNIKIKEAKDMEMIMIKKAKELNYRFNVDIWTPRKVDMILWSYGRC